MVEKTKSAEEGGRRLAGFHAVSATLRREPDTIETLWLDRGRHDPRMRKIASLAREAGVDIQRVERSELDRIGNGLRHQGVVARLRDAPPRSGGNLFAFLGALTKEPFLLVLDQVQDPHNLGACLRTAECAGVDAVILPRDGAAPVNDTVRRVAAGAAERMPVFTVTNLARTLAALKEEGVWITGTSDAGDDSLYAVDLTGPLAVVLGAEGSGIRRLTAEACDRVVRIPMAGAVSSLNVSVATGVALFEARRQRDRAAADGKVDAVV